MIDEVDDFSYNLSLIADELAMRCPGLGAPVQPDAGWLMDL
jgi:hypothetical protein